MADAASEPEPTHDEKGRPFINLASLAKHSSREDIWMSIAGKVYNVSEYLDDHPGGEEVLLDRAGKDATEDFEDVGHSNEARKQLKKYEVGELPPSEKAKAAAQAEAGAGGGMALVVVPLLVAAVGVAYYYYTQMM